MFGEAEPRPLAHRTGEREPRAPLLMRGTAGGAAGGETFLTLYMPLFTIDIGLIHVSQSRRKCVQI